MVKPKNLKKEKIDFNYAGIKHKTKDTFSNTSIHCLPTITNAPNLSNRLFWTSCFLLSGALCCYFISLSVTNYLNHDIVTISNSINEQRSQFPTVSFCRIGDSLTDLPIISCLFNFNNCSLNDFVSFNDTNYGTCYRFNSGKNMTNGKIPILESISSGSRYGLNLDFNLSQASSIEFNELALFIHNHTISPMSLRNRGYKILTGSINYFEIHRTVDEKLEQPYNECYKDLNKFPLNKTLVDFLKKSNTGYNYLECIRFCRNINFVEKSNCNCATTYVTLAGCSKSKNQSYRACYDKHQSDFQKLDVFEECSKFCPIECDSISYDISAFVQNLPAFGNITSSKLDLAGFGTYEEVKKNYISISVYYPNLIYTYIKQNPKTEIFDLVSSVGGTFGLFLGISFIGIIEVLEWFIQIVFILPFKKNA